MSRHVVMRRDQPIPRLLGIVGGKPQKSRIIEPDDPNAPPITSSDEDDSTSHRGDIRGATFGKESNGEHTGVSRTKQSPDVGNSTRKTLKTKPQITSAASSRPSRSKRQPGSDDNNGDEIASPKPFKKVKEKREESNTLGSQFEKDPFKQPSSKRPGGGYGTNHKAYGKSGKASYNQVSTYSSLLSTPEKASKFTVPVKFELDSPSPSKSFKAPPACGGIGVDSPSPAKSFKRPPVSGARDPSSSPVSKQTLKGSANLRRMRGKNAARKGHLLDEAASSQQVSFKMPSLGTVDMNFDSDVDSIDGGAELKAKSVHKSASLSGEDRRSPVPGGPVCPFCGEYVEQELLDSFAKTKWMTLAQQQKFCQHHKVKSAREAWVHEGYPDIDWLNLEGRMTKHRQIIEDILQGGPSHYVDLFSEKVKTGLSKTVMKTKQSLTPGYYGIRGLRIMTESIINHFSSLLRKRAVRDRLISARGHTAYVQAVLVPELTVQLIMEDMDVPQEQARTILQESIMVGELLNEEIGDIVANEDGSDNESTSSLSSLSDFSGVSDDDVVIEKVREVVAIEEERDSMSTSPLSSLSGIGF